MKRILEPNAEKRLTAAQILKDPWVVKLAGTEENENDKQIEESKPTEKINS